MRPSIFEYQMEDSSFVNASESRRAGKDIKLMDWRKALSKIEMWLPQCKVIQRIGKVCKFPGRLSMWCLRDQLTWSIVNDWMIVSRTYDVWFYPSVVIDE